MEEPCKVLLKVFSTSSEVVCILGGVCVELDPHIEPRLKVFVFLISLIVSSKVSISTVNKCSFSAKFL